VEYDHLIKVKKIEEDMDITQAVNENSKFTTRAVADPMVRELNIGDIIQFERRGFFIVDKFHIAEKGDKVLELIFIPDGKTKNMSNITTQLDQSQTSKGKNVIEKN